MSKRVVLEYYKHPKFYRKITEEEFNSIKKKKVHSEKGIIDGHKKTVVYLAEKSSDNFEYYTKIILKEDTFYVVTSCTFIPTFGMDSLDGSQIENAEHWIISQYYNIGSPRIKEIFGDKEKVHYQEYFKVLNFPVGETTLIPKQQVSIKDNVSDVTKIMFSKTNKPWWRFW